MGIICKILHCFFVLPCTRSYIEQNYHIKLGISALLFDNAIEKSHNCVKVITVVAAQTDQKLF